ncbi:MAG: type I toxin-antitoxin system antitoxin YafN [Saccharospirillum sp.]
MRILAEQTVSITELRKNPARYFINEPVAVLSNNKPAGYMLSADLFNTLVQLLEQNEPTKGTVGQFRPTALRLKAIAEQGHTLFKDATDEQLGDFKE